MSESRDDLIAYRLERARETLKDARILADVGSWNSCVNRLYYACFYAVSALLLQRGLQSTKHSGIRSLFNLHFVKTGLISKRLGETYNDLFEYRQEGDYADLARFQEDQVRPWLAKAEEFVARIEALCAK